jgi:phosphoserine phosphatase
MSSVEWRDAKQLVLLDWDGVLRPGFLVIDWAEYLKNEAAFSPDDLHLMKNQLDRYRDRTASYADIAQAIPELYAKGLQGFNVDEHLNIAAKYAASGTFRSSLSPLAIQLLAFIRESRGLWAVIISGGPASILRLFGESVGIREVRAVEVEAKDDIFTGRILDNPAIMDRKQELVTKYSSLGRILLAAGDSESDQPMLMAASYRIAIGGTLASEWRGDPNTLTLPAGDLSQSDARRIESFLYDLEKL